jgi:hypothetical protein
MTKLDIILVQELSQYAVGYYDMTVPQLLEENPADFDNYVKYMKIHYILWQLYSQQPEHIQEHLQYRVKDNSIYFFVKQLDTLYDFELDCDWRMEDMVWKFEK